MTHLETRAKDLLPQPRGLEAFLLAEPAPTVSSLVTWGLVVRLILGKLEMRVRTVLVFLVSEPYGLISRLVLADADPLGVNQNVTFEEVGGLDDRELTLCVVVTSPEPPPKISTR